MVIKNAKTLLKFSYCHSFGSQTVKNLPANAGDLGSIPSVRKIPLEKGIATHSSIFAWRIPWTEEPGGPQFMGWQRVRHKKRLTHTSIKENKG